MGMLALKRQKWTGLLPVILLWLLPGNAAAQNNPQPVSQAETQCIVSTTEDVLQNDPFIRSNFNKMMNYIRTQSCPNGEQAAQKDLDIIMQSMLTSTYQPVIKKCFPAGLHLNPNVSEILSKLPYIMQPVFNKAIPRPLCP